jgi:hypothetical protein
VRLAERNNFQTALINYQRQRRALMSFEDNLKYQLRQDIRFLHQYYLFYEITKRNLVLNIRQKDQAFEQIVAPPTGAAGVAQVAQAATQTSNLVAAQGRLIGAEVTLTQNWQLYETQRLQLYRDLGNLPYDEWEAFYELFPSVAREGGSTAAPGRGGVAAGVRPGGPAFGPRAAGGGARPARTAQADPAPGVQPQ